MQDVHQFCLVSLSKKTADMKMLEMDRVLDLEQKGDMWDEGQKE